MNIFRKIYDWWVNPAYAVPPRGSAYKLGSWTAPSSASIQYTHVLLDPPFIPPEGEEVVYAMVTQYYQDPDQRSASAVDVHPSNMLGEQMWEEFPLNSYETFITGSLVAALDNMGYEVK